MKKYDFTTVLNRKKTGSSKWEQMLGWKPDVEEGIIPFSVADMELKNPPEVIKGLQEYLNDVVLGYSTATPGFLKSVTDWTKRRYGWETSADWLVTTPGVVNAFYHAVRVFTQPGEGVIVMPPVYYPFYGAIEKNDRKVVRNSLINNEGHYEINFEDLEEKAKDPENTLLMLCSPHNPVGRVWTKEELEKIGRICIDNNVYIVSDEIHCDLIMPGYQHTTFAGISEEFAQHSFTCIAPSKTFNLAGMQSSNIFIPDQGKRQLYLQQLEKVAQSNRLGILGYKACEIAYTECDEWLEQLIQLIDTNRKQLTEFLADRLPQIKVINMEGTYLQWLDFRELGWDYKKLEEIMQQEAQLFFDEGYVFGREGEGYERINLACPTSVIMEALLRLETAVKNHM